MDTVLKHENVEEKNLDPAYLPQILKNKRYVSLRGVHLLVHTSFGPITSALAVVGGQSVIATSPFQYNDVEHPLLWPESKARPIPSYIDEESKRLLGRTLQSESVENLGKWYQKSCESIKKDANVDIYQTARARCFTIDIDPIFSNTSKDLLATFGLAPAEYDKLSEMTSKKSFDKLEQLFAKEIKLNPGDYWVIDEQKVHDGTTKPRRQKSMYLNEKILEKNPEILKRLVRYNAVISSVYYFIKNQLAHLFDTFWIRNQRRHYFIEIIGFASPDDWTQSAHDYSFALSRFKAFEKWVANSQEKTPVSGFYTVQQVPVASFGETDSRRSSDSDIHFIKDTLFSQIQPINDIITPFSEIDPRFKLDEEFWRSQYEGMANQQNIFASPHVLNHWRNVFANLNRRTSLPMMLWESVVMRSQFQQFHEDEFDLEGASTIGRGGFGFVIKVNWKHSDKYLLQDYEKIQGGLFKHHSVIFDALNDQYLLMLQSLYFYELGLKSFAYELNIPKNITVREINFIVCDDNNCEQAISFNFANNTAKIEDYAIARALVFQALHHENRNVKLDPQQFYAKLESELGGRKLTIPKIVSYSTSVSIDFVVKIGVKPDFKLLQEEMLGEIIGYNRLFEFADRAYHNPINGRIEAGELEQRPLFGLVDTENHNIIFNRDNFVLRIIDGNKLRKVCYNFNLSSTLLSRLGFDENGNIIEMKLLTADHVLTSYGRLFDNRNVLSVIPMRHLGSLMSMVLDIKEEYDYNNPLYPVTIGEARRIKRDLMKKIGSDSVRPLSLYEYVSILRDEINAINYVNSIGISHNDVKHDNTLVNANRQGFLSDLGLARAHGTPHSRGYTGLYIPVEFLPQTKTSAKPLFDNLYAVDGWFDGYCFGKSLDMNTIYDIENIQNRFYTDAQKARYVGTCYNAVMLRKLFSQGDFEPVLSTTTRLIRDKTILASQCPLTEETAAYILNILDTIRQELTKQTTVDRVITDIRFLESGGLRVSQLNPYIADGNEQYVGMNRLRFAESLLELSLAIMEADVDKQWSSHVKLVKYVPFPTID